MIKINISRFVTEGSHLDSVYHRRSFSSMLPRRISILPLSKFLELNCLFNNSFVIIFQQNETALEIAQRKCETTLDIDLRKNYHDIMQILQQYQHKSPRTNPSKYPEKSVDDTTEEEFDVDAIMKGNDFTKKNFSFHKKILNSREKIICLFS